ncbi:hypothetical protein GCM10027051_05920 [Niabella terrae]
MKKIASIVLIAAAIFVTTGLHAQSIDGVVGGLKSGSAEKVAANAGKNLTLNVQGKSSTYSKTQAQQIIKDFFSKNSVKGFELKHKGSSPSGHYAIGTLSTGNGNYRVNIFMKNEGSKEVIKELRFQLIE